MAFQEKIPTTTYKKKFLKKLFDIEPYVVSKNDILGNSIIHELYNTKYTPDVRTLSSPQYNDFILIAIPESYANKYKIKGISEDAIKAINNYIDRLFDLYFKNILDYSLERNQNKKIKELITEFTSLYELNEDDIAYETLKKKFYRFRNEKLLKSVKKLN